MCSLCLGHEPISSPQYASSVIFGPVAFARLAGLSVQSWGALGRFDLQTPHGIAVELSFGAQKRAPLRPNIEPPAKKKVATGAKIPRRQPSCKKLAVSASSRGVISIPSLGPLERR